MSDAPSAEDRWRHTWAAFVLGAIAVIALGLIAFVLTTSPVHSHNAAPPLLLTEVPSPTAPKSAATSASSSARRPSASPTTARSTASSHPAPRTTAAAAPTVVATRSSVPARPSRPVGVPCRSSAPCVVGGTYQVSAALDAYRRDHGLSGVPTTVTAAAQQCAATGGDGASCGNPFAVAPESRPDGRAAIRDIGAGTGNFLLDPGLGTVEVGWAYDPRTGQYVCALLDRS